MAPPILTSNPTLTLTPEPLTVDSFSPFGTAISPPLPRHVITAPPLTTLPKHNPAPVLANQSSALKYSPISPLLNNYPAQSPSNTPSEPRMSMFSCFPRRLRQSTTPGKKNNKLLFDVAILERHPYTTQTFAPLGLSADGDGEETFFLVIVAPTLKGEVATATMEETGERVTVRDPPDLTRLRAFVARGDQAVTYGAGTWHAPMVVVGKKRVDFVVVQFVNGVDEEDCQEVRFGEGVVVEVGSGGGGAREARL